MESSLVYTSLCILLLTILVVVLATKLSRKKFKNLPPSPPSLPIIGHFHLLIKQPIHQTLHYLSRKYGPDLLLLKFGTKLVIVASSQSAVDECFTKQDINFANRKSTLGSKYITYNNTTLISSNYGDHWRNLRRICAVEIFSSARLNHFRAIREDEVKTLLRRLNCAIIESRDINGVSAAKVDFKSMFFDLKCNNIMRMIVGKRYCGEDVDDVEEARQLKEVLEEYVQAARLSSGLADWFPILKLFDCGGSMNKLAKFYKKMDTFFQKLIDQHREEKERNSMISHLLALQESGSDYYTDEVIKGLVLVMLTAGIETTITSLEWAFCNLLNHPNVLEQARIELDAQVGKGRLVNESDLPKLQYLQNMISENLRLYPVAPLLVPHVSSVDCTVGGYDVPAGTVLLVNAWSIHRDPELWEEPTSFKPERFENGNDEQEAAAAAKQIAFGLGRRSCPGDGMANRVMALTLGSMIQCFDWEKMCEDEIDMSEKAGMLLKKAEPLEALCKPRPNLEFVLSL